MSRDRLDRLRAALVQVLPATYRSGVMPWVFFVGVLLGLMFLGLSVVEYRNYGDRISMYFGLSVFALMWAFHRGLSFRHTVHLAMAIALLAQWLAAWQSGGMYSPRLAWLVLLPLTPFFFFGRRTGLQWLVVVLLSVVALGVATGLGWIDASRAGDERHLSSSWGSFALLAAFMLVIPMSYHRMNERALLEQRQRRAELERQRAELERTQVLRDRFIASVSHELRTPMNAILGLNAWLLDQVKEAPEAQRVLQHTRQSADHLMTVINDVLDYSQLQSGTLQLHPDSTDLTACVRGAFDMLSVKAQDQGLDYRCAIDPDVPVWVWVDRHRLTQVLVNLLGNAIKFTPSGEVELTVSRQDTSVRFEVRDTGIGIPPSQRERLFRRFAQADASIGPRFGGHGLGRAISRRLVSLLGGELDFTSQEGEGSRFFFVLPLTATTAPAPAAATPQPLQTVHRSWCFLVVDDHPVNRLLVQRVLASSWPKARVLEAADGLEALAAVQAAAVDVVFMDMRMPVMDGADATAAIRRLPGSAGRTLVMGLTANVNQDDLNRFEASGLDSLMLKPFDWRELCLRAESLLLQREAGG